MWFDLCPKCRRFPGTLINYTIKIVPSWFKKTPILIFIRNITRSFPIIIVVSEIYFLIKLRFIQYYIDTIVVILLINSNTYLLVFTSNFHVKSHKTELRMFDPLDEPRFQFLYYY